jgi:hypothetical protein
MLRRDTDEAGAAASLGGIDYRSAEMFIAARRSAQGQSARSLP